MKGRFKKEPKEYNDRTCVIVIDIKEISIGLIVDSVSEVISIPDTEIVAPPEVTKGTGKFIKGIGKVDGDVRLILDCDMLLSEDEVDNLTISTQ